jgi:uncharacterized protein with HEPN domain
MSDCDDLLDRLKSIQEALERIPRRFADINSPFDFLNTERGIDRMDSICMILIAVGEEFKAIDRKTSGKLLQEYPEIQWRGIMGVRDVLAHGYFQVNTEQLFTICREDIPKIIRTVQKMILDIQDHAGPNL